MKAHASVWLILFFGLALSAGAQELLSLQDSLTAQPSGDGLPLPPQAKRIADSLGVRDAVAQISQMPAGERAPSTESLLLRQRITEATLTTSLEMDGVLAQIDDEVAHLATVRAELEGNRDRQLSINNVANLVAG